MRKIKIIAAENKFIILLFFYCVAYLVLRLLVSGSLEKDEAEMLFYFQQPLALGYNSQPPLYNWLQIALFKVFGLHIFSLAVLKNSLIFLFYFFLYKSACRVLKSELPAILSTVSLFLVYNFSWILHKDLTHSVLLIALCSLSFYLFLSVLERQRLKDYLWLGVVMALGFMTKYNYIVFILALLLSALTITEYRKAVCNRKAALGFMLCFALVVPHLLWAVGNISRVTLDLGDFEIAGRGAGIPFKGLLLAFNGAFLFLLPLAVLYAIFFPQGFKKASFDHAGRKDLKRFFERFFIFSALLVLACIFASRLQHIKVRWLQPFLFLVPLYFFLRLGQKPLRPARASIFLVIAALCAVSTLFSIYGRVFFASARGKYSRLNYPYRQLAAAIRRDGFNKGLIVAGNHIIGADLKLYFPDSLVVVADERFGVAGQKAFDSVLVVWENEDSSIPEALREYVLKFGFDPLALTVVRKRQPYRYADGAYYEVNIAIGRRQSSG